MRAVICREWGPVTSLRVEEMASPPLPPDSVRIEVHAAGVNFADTLIVQGQYQERPPFPFSPGMEVSGVVTEVAPEVRNLQVGQRVLAFLDYGGFAEEVTARAIDVTPMPDSMTFAVAAAFPVVYVTSHLALRDRARLQQGEVLLVHGASGGVGLTAVEIGHAVGATVIATASTQDKLALALEHGAKYVVLSSDEAHVRTQVQALTGGIDVAYDPVGGEMFAASLHLIRPQGRIVIIGFASGTVPQIPANHLLVKDASAIGFSLGQTRRNRPDEVRAALGELCRWYDEGRIRPHVSQEFPLDDAVDALVAIQQRRVAGKAIIRMRDTE
ncbi:MAG: NADPH:quinone oxidoreductase family protein [Dehalococcoidia bacterium]|nr:MAG: NADPH:quinone oxidoreductase family protein [Dehalococcoidia bacterium]